MHINSTKNENSKCCLIEICYHFYYRNKIWIASAKIMKNKSQKRVLPLALTNNCEIKSQLRSFGNPGKMCVCVCYMCVLYVYILYFCLCENQTFKTSVWFMFLGCACVCYSFSTWLFSIFQKVAIQQAYSEKSKHTDK